jgi:hypothetical protein
VRRMCLCSPDKKIKTEAKSKKKNCWFLCSEGGRVEHGRILILTKQIVKYKGVVLPRFGALNIRELVLPRVGALNIRELVLPRVGALKTRELVLPRVGALKKGIGVS